MVVAAGDTGVLPLTGWLPFHPTDPPEAVQEVAFVLDHVRVADWPAVIDVGLATSKTVGALAAPTLTVVLLLSVPPAPTHISV